VVLAGGVLMARTRGPEIKQIEQADSDMAMILYLASSSISPLQIYFQRPREESQGSAKENEAYVTFYSPRQGIPTKMGVNHFRFPLIRAGLYPRIVALMKVFEYELPDRDITVHFGWPLSSWIDRISIGVMVYKLMRLPRLFPQFNFVINYYRQWRVTKVQAGLRDGP
jgi:hypothetical protein